MVEAIYSYESVLCFSVLFLVSFGFVSFLVDEMRSKLAEEVEPTSDLSRLKSGFDRGRTGQRKEPNDCSLCNGNNIHIGIVSIGENTTRDVSVTIKSILAHRSTALHLHLLVDHASEEACSFESIFFIGTVYSIK